jgi:hypothetical protein
MLLYLILKPVGVDIELAGALQSEDPEDLLKATAPLVRAFCELDEWVVNNGGRTLCKWGEFFCLCISADVIDKFSEFSKRWEYTTKLCFAIGAGATPMEAFYAMSASEAKGGEAIVLYSSDLEATMGDMSKSELRKDGDEPFGFSFPNLNLDEPDPSQQPQSQPEPQQDDSLKQKVVQALMQVKQSAQAISSLKDSNPDAYSAVTALIEAMLELAKQTSDKPAESQPQAKPETNA